MLLSLGISARAIAGRRQSAMSKGASATRGLSAVVGGDRHFVVPGAQRIEQI